MITSVIFRNFKAFEYYTVPIKDLNILVGSNNNGKSTILDGFRALQGAYRFAQHYKATIITLADGRTVWGYDIPDYSLTISTANAQTNFSSEPALITFKFKDGQALFLELAPDTTSKLYSEANGKSPRTPNDFKKAFPLKLAVIPTLGPLEGVEDLLNTDYLKRWHGGRNSPRMFRNYWFQIPGLFDEFKALVEKTWPGMSIERPEKKAFPSKELMMFYREERMSREVCWAGFGFQIWLQLLTHIIAAKDADLLVVDEPEIYLHPDLQHKILDILKEVKPSVILATHSIEIINNAEPNEVLMVDKKLKNAKRLSALDELQNVASLLGSNQNIQLTRLARGKRILFVEGQDVKLLSRFARLVDFGDLFSNGIITVIPIDGFSHHTRINHTSWTFQKVLGEEIRLAALLDRDYRADNDVAAIRDGLLKDIDLAHILTRKEIENYLLVPSAIKKAIVERIKEKCSSSPEELDVEDLLNEATEYFKIEVNSQLMANTFQSIGKTKKADATMMMECINAFESKWADMSNRLCMVPGKRMFSKINEIIQQKYQVSITHNQVVKYMKRDDLGVDLLAFLTQLNVFSTD